MTISPRGPFLIWPRPFDERFRLQLSPFPGLLLAWPRLFSNWATTLALVSCKDRPGSSPASSVEYTWIAHPRQGLQKTAQACIPPCGLQEFARRFLCSGCYSRVCDLPLDCPGEGAGPRGAGGQPEKRDQSTEGHKLVARPDVVGAQRVNTAPSSVQDVTVTRGDQAMFSCIVNFQLPKEEITYSWKFAGGGLRTQDLSYFRDMPRAEGYLARIRPAQLTHRGTFSCVIKQDQRPLARLYFFLNVTGPPPRAETELQASFREVLRWAPRDAELIEPWRPSLGELLARPEALTPSNLFLLAVLGALASASATVVAWMFFRWYCSGN
ncbi:sperm acrosome membrane-associated protein 6 isoform X8 [Gorilla gorilla gorilla]|uniref:sperm acrosome membrane-associated protein 6 isoform X8 n=1 Tax=Gorilla gorilla gorilla TaxID=9595 RepID=UPI00123E7613|nr:sperm acrosome membrane-associated protein 6 isoform X9 [Gorilla gorilla gorilla]XP_055226253.1 sperm acrosome membrane-associated protein 6 isoform X9 [Gorilla gorilla gorilla]XP_055226254.1 sperm acrosome membrane-associated protein 6 isoform X9 [Gorilla gorilla gorilla]